jgi:NAD(P)H-dependent flavin oxidoreductase YrpB (nitropropane dioxygenase family)
VVLGQRLRDALARLNPILLADRNPSRLLLLSEEAGMFELTRGNLLDAEVEAVVNTINTEGIMGKGIALQFRKAYPENYEAYQRACKVGEVQPGRM